MSKVKMEILLGKLRARFGSFFLGGVVAFLLSLFSFGITYVKKKKLKLAEIIAPGSAKQALLIHEN